MLLYQIRFPDKRNLLTLKTELMAVLQAAKAAVAWAWAPSESKVAESGVRSLSDSFCHLISIQLLVFTGWFAPGFSLFSLLGHVLGRAQAVKQRRKKCGGNT